MSTTLSRPDHAPGNADTETYAGPVTDDAAPDDAAAVPHRGFDAAPRLAGVLAEYENEATLEDACEQVRDAGFTRWDAYTPYPVHGIERRMGIKPTILPWVVLCGGLTGVTTGILMQWYLNAGEHFGEEVGMTVYLQGYNYLISGKPIWSLPANIPVSFELTILFSAFGAFFGMLALNGLPRWSNPRFRLSRFRKATDDRFFIGVDSKDPKFDVESVGRLLGGTGAVSMQECWDREDRTLPGWMPAAGLILFAVLLIPPVLIAKHRNIPWQTPRIHPVGDMDWQPKFKPQEVNPFFADDRAQRPQVDHTIARGELDLNAALWRGVITDPGTGAEAAAANAAVTSFAAFVQDGERDSRDTPGGESKSGDTGSSGGTDTSADAPEPDWTEGIPAGITVDLDTIRRGQERFNIFCAPCHGVAGLGNGLVNQRASSLQQPTWLPVPSLHTVTTRNRPNGFLYDSITNGVRKMPAYGSQIPLADRWAVVLYVRALQRSHDAEMSAVPAKLRPRVERERAAAEEAARKEAEAAKAREAAAEGDVGEKQIGGGAGTSTSAAPPGS